MWYLLKTKPRQEFRAKKHLRNQLLVAYLPVLTRKDKRVEPLFPGYLFIAADSGSNAIGAVRSTRGVLGFVRFGAEIAMVPESLIQEINTLEHRFRDLPKFTPGQEVVCKSGPFAGLHGIFETESGEQRCIILLKLLNSERPVRVRQSELQAL